MKAGRCGATFQVARRHHARWKLAPLFLALAIAAWPEAAARAGEFAGEERSTTCKVETRDGLVFVPVQLNGAAARWFVLDTGSSRMLIERNLARELKIPLEGNGSLGGAGTGRIPVEFARHVLFEIPGLAMPGIELAAADLTGLESMVGRPVEGIIGYEFFISHVVAVDYEANTLTVTTPEAFQPPPDAESIPVTFDQKWIRVKATLSLPGIAPVEDMFLVDSGSSDAADHPQVANAAGRAGTNVGNGLGAPGAGFVARANSLRLGKFVMRGMTAVSVTNEAVGPLMGAEVFRRFHIIYDYPGHRIFLRPNRFFNEE